MFYPFIGTFIVMLIMTTILTTGNITGNAVEVRMLYEKAKYTFNVEDAIKDATDSYCQTEPLSCKALYSQASLSITIPMSNLASHLPLSFQNSNLMGGSYGNVIIKDNNSTIQLIHNIPDATKRRVYLTHYRGNAYSVSPQCVSGIKTSTPPCDSENVFHDFPTRFETRIALK